jgi:hypothetical protein
MMGEITKHLFCVTAQNYVFYNISELNLFSESLEHYFMPNNIALNIHMYIYYR